ncbi:MAG: hemolysin III family protein [Bacilli bacterium]
MPRSYFFNTLNDFSFVHDDKIFLADVIVIDQSDAVTIFSNSGKYAPFLSLLNEHQSELYLKINLDNEKQFKNDLKKIDGNFIKGWAIPHASASLLNHLVMKVRDFEQSQKLDFGTLNFIAMIDSPEGVISYRKIANYERVKALFFDEKKYREFLGWTIDGNIDFAFNQVAFASALSKKPLIDRICHEDDDLLTDLKKGKNFGCTAKATQNLDQIKTINDFYSPTEEELHEALNIINQYWDSPKKQRHHFMIDGKQISPLQIYHSQEILLRSQKFPQNELANGLIIKGEKVLISKKIPPTKKFYTVGEEIGNAITHGVGILMAIVGLIILVIKGMQESDNNAIFAYFIYVFSAILLFSSSTLYHGLPLGGRAKKLFQKFDHMTIYLLIAGTYTPYTLLAIGGTLGVVLCSLMWASALIGLLMNVFWFGKFKIFHLLLYVGLGWMAFFYLKTIINTIGIYGTVLLFAGGIAYTVGIIFYALKLFKFTHMVWHFFVIIGFILHFLSIYLFV